MNSKPSAIIFFMARMPTAKTPFNIKMFKSRLAMAHGTAKKKNPTRQSSRIPPSMKTKSFPLMHQPHPKYAEEPSPEKKHPSTPKCLPFWNRSGKKLTHLTFSSTAMTCGMASAKNLFAPNYSKNSPKNKLPKHTKRPLISTSINT